MNETFSCERHTMPRKRNMTDKEFQDWFQSKLILNEGTGCMEWSMCRVSQGYGVIRIQSKNIRTHRLALEFKLGIPIQDKLDVLHSCNNPPCCNPEHLREGDNLENMKDKVLANRQPRGDTNGNSKLKTEQVLQIRQLKGVKSQKEIANMFNVQKACIAKIHRNEKWKHLVQ